MNVVISVAERKDIQVIEDNRRKINKFQGAEHFFKKYQQQNYILYEEDLEEKCRLMTIILKKYLFI